MKFGKQLQIYLEETPPEWRDHFVAYKQLKKRLKLLKYAPEGFAQAAFIPNDASDSNVARVDSMLRNGTEIGHYDDPLHLAAIRRFPDAHEGARVEAAAAAAVAGAREEEEEDEEEEEEDLRFGEIEGEEMQSAGAGGGSRKRKSRESTPDSQSESEDESDDDLENVEFENGQFSMEQLEFKSLLDLELKKLNRFFCRKEEEYVMRLRHLKERAERMKERTALRTHLSERECREMTNIYSQMITFHGEVVLLETYSSLNYTGLVKILKKHDKWTKGGLRICYIKTVLRQPFYTTEVLSQIVKDCEVNLSFLLAAPSQEPVVEMNAEEPRAGNSLAGSDPAVGGDLHRPDSPASEDEASGDGEGLSPATQNLDGVYRIAVSALKAIEGIRRGSSTYSALSMPPLNLGDVDDGLGVVIDEPVARDSPAPCRSPVVSVSQV